MVVVVVTLTRIMKSVSTEYLRTCCSRGSSIVPVAPYSSGDIAWRSWEQQVVAVCGVVPVAAIVPIFPAHPTIAATGTTAMLLLFSY